MRNNYQKQFQQFEPFKPICSLTRPFIDLNGFGFSRLNSFVGLSSLFAGLNYFSRFSRLNCLTGLNRSNVFFREA